MAMHHLNDSSFDLDPPTNSTVADPNRFNWIYNFVGLTELFVTIVGTPLNALVLLAACSRRKGMTLRSRRNITECLVISMASADLLFSTVHAPLGFVYFYTGARLTRWPCWIFYTSTHVSTIASSLSLLWLNVNKFLQLHRPLHYYLYMTKSRALMFIAGAWTISIVWGLLFVFGPFMEYEADECNPRLIYPALYIFFATEFFVLPTVVSLFVSIDIAAVVLNRRRFRQLLLRSSTTRTNATGGGGYRRSPPDPPLGTGENETGRRGSSYQHQSFATVVPQKREKNSARDPANIRRITFVFATTIWTGSTILPYRLSYIIHFLPGYRPTEIGVSIAFVLFGVMALNAAGNPLITLLTHKQYTSQIRDWFRCSIKSKVR